MLFGDGSTMFQRLRQQQQTMMSLLFLCPRTGQDFTSCHFEIRESNGVVRDEHGAKTLDAKVVLTAPCPCCGERHIYRAADLSCPFAKS